MRSLISQPTRQRWASPARIDFFLLLLLSFGQHYIAFHSAATWIWSFSSSCFLWLAESSHTHLWILGSYTAPEWCVMRLPRVQHLSCAKLHAAWKCEGYHEVINLSQVNQVEPEEDTKAHLENQESCNPNFIKSKRYPGLFPEGSWELY